MDHKAASGKKKDWTPTGSRLDPDWISTAPGIEHTRKTTNTSERQIPPLEAPAMARNLGPHQRRPYVFLEYPASLIKGEGRKKHTVKLISLLPDMNPSAQQRCKSNTDNLLHQARASAEESGKCGPKVLQNHSENKAADEGPPRLWDTA